MSRIGKQPITLPAGVTVQYADGVVSVNGPKGSLKQDLDARVSVQVADGQVLVTVQDSTKQDQRAQWGLARSLVQNMVTGVSEGFKKSLSIHGVGYKFDLQGTKLVLSVGFSHKVEMPLPNDVLVEMDPEEKNLIHISGADKQRVGEIAAKIREVKKPEPYKGKGIRYVDERVRRKAGKTGAK